MSELWYLSLCLFQLNSDSERTVIFKRQPNGEFGFLLRRSQVVDVYGDGTEQTRAIVLAEPLQQQPSREIFHNGDSSSSSALPRDQLVAVNGQPIDQMSRDELISFINRSEGDTIQLTVKSAPPLIPATQRATNGTAAAVNGVEDISGADEVDFLTVCQQSPAAITGGEHRKSGPTERFDNGEDMERVWLVHRDGYAAGTVVNGRGATHDATGKLRIRLIDVPGEVVIEVDAVDVEKSNPASSDKAEELAQLLYLNESSVIHLLRQRHAASLIHTYAGSVSLLVTKPQVPLAIYSDKVRVVRCFPSI